MAFKVPEKYRYKFPRGAYAEYMNEIPKGEKNGAFKIPHRMKSLCYLVIATEGFDLVPWEHVSVSIRLSKSMKDLDRCPTWEEMCRIKDLFWDPEDCVVQFHPPESEYVSDHHYTLHLWRKKDQNWETPPPETVGRKAGTKKV